MSGLVRNFSKKTMNGTLNFVLFRVKKAMQSTWLISPWCRTCVSTRMQEVPVSMGALILCLTKPLFCTGSRAKGIFSFAIWSLARGLAWKPPHRTAQDEEAPEQWSFVTSLPSPKKLRPPPSSLPSMAKSWLTAHAIMRWILGLTEHEMQAGTNLEVGPSTSPSPIWLDYQEVTPPFLCMFFYGSSSCFAQIW